MKKISYSKMADVVSAKRKEKKLTQAQLADMTGIHRAMLSRLEGQDYIPSNWICRFIYCNSSFSASPCNSC